MLVMLSSVCNHEQVGHMSLVYTVAPNNKFLFNMNAGVLVLETMLCALQRIEDL